MKSIDLSLNLMPNSYPHPQVKNRDEAMTVTCGSVPQLLMAGRKSYDISFKLKAVAATESKSKEAVAREFKADA